MSRDNQESEGNRFGRSNEVHTQRSIANAYDNTEESISIASANHVDDGSGVGLPPPPFSTESTPPDDTGVTSIYNEDFTLKAWKNQSSLKYNKRPKKLKKIDRAIKKMVNAFNNLNPLDIEERIRYIRDVQLMVDNFIQANTENGVFNSKRSNAILELEQYLDQKRLDLTNQLKGESSPLPIPDEYNRVLAYGLADVIQDYQHVELGNGIDQVGDASEERNKHEYSDLEVRIEKINEKLQEASIHLEENAQGNTNTIGVFTAPEWYFSQPDKPYSEQDVELIEAKLMNLSAQYHNMLIIPGSILWQGESDEGKTLKNTAISYMHGQIVHRVDKYNEGIDVSMYTEKSETGRSIPQSRQDFKQQWIRGGGTMEQQVGELSNNDQTSIFEVGNLKVAVEICADHNSGRARQELNNLMGNSDEIENDGFDLQILLSAGATFSNNDDKNGLKSSGVAISNDATQFRDRMATRRLYQGREQAPISELHRSEDLNNVFIGEATLNSRDSIESSDSSVGDIISNETNSGEQ